MKILLIDTETNGLPVNRYAPPSEWAGFPALIQISWLIYSPDLESRCLGQPLARRDITVRLPPGTPWNTEAAAIHGMSQEAVLNGLPITVALMELYEVMRSVDCICAHNLAFDRSVIRAAGYAAADRGGPRELRGIWPRGLIELCTMNVTRDLMRLTPGPDGTRWKAPRLGELYAWLYGHRYDISGAVLHSARSDVHCLAQCLSGLLRRDYLRFDRSTGWVSGLPLAPDNVVSSGVAQVHPS